MKSKLFSVLNVLSLLCAQCVYNYSLLLCGQKVRMSASHREMSLMCGTARSCCLSVKVSFWAMWHIGCFVLKPYDHIYALRQLRGGDVNIKAVAFTSHHIFQVPIVRLVDLEPRYICKNPDLDGYQNTGLWLGGEHASPVIFFHFYYFPECIACNFFHQRNQDGGLASWLILVQAGHCIKTIGRLCSQQK